MNRTPCAGLALVVATVALVAAAVVPASAGSEGRRNTAAVLGGVAAFGLIKGETTVGVVAGAGAAYAYKRYQDAKEDEYRYDRYRYSDNRYRYDDRYRVDPRDRDHYRYSDSNRRECDDKRRYDTHSSSGSRSYYLDRSDNRRETRCEERRDVRSRNRRY